jgi:hypothetical protein
MGWTRQTTTRPNLIGRAGEEVVHASLEAAVKAGTPYRLEQRSLAGVTHLFRGTYPVPVGPLDDAAYFAGFTEEGQPILVTILIEAKNVRHWIYPADWEIYQLLDKAAQLQVEFPDRGFVPILVARRIQYLTFLMAEELGFRCLYFNRQPILPHSDLSDEGLAEVVNELGYDIVKTVDAHEKIADGFMRLPQAADVIAERWRHSAPVVRRFASALRDDAVIGLERAALMDEFRQACADELGCTRAWLGQKVLGTLEDDYGYEIGYEDW